MSKEQILSEIRRTATENGGVPLGEDRFSTASGIRRADWFGKYWVRWGDAVREAGFRPNRFNEALQEEYILTKLADFVKDLGHFPVSGELRLKARNDPKFPSHNTFIRLGKTKKARAEKLRIFCLERDHKDVAEICAPITESAIEPESEAEPMKNIEYGFVYLMKSGKYYKIGRTDSLGRREWELKIALPDEIKTIHSIKTDDPKGIEKYWHERFKDRRKNGEWFELSHDDVVAFRRRKFM
jgi:hypothetical protein